MNRIRTRLLKYLDHVSFPKVVGELVRNHPALQHVVYTAAFPKEEEVTDLPRIVYSLKSRVPGKAGLETLKARRRPSSAWKNEDGTISQLYAQWQTCLFQFDICASAAEQAEELLQLFDELILESIPVFKQLGADDLFFDEQLEDALLPRVKDVVVRSIRYRVILERVKIRTTPAIQEIRVRTFYPQDEAYEAVVRGQTGAEYADIDALQQTHISRIICVADEQPDGIARPDPDGKEADTVYVADVDYKILYDPAQGETYLHWLEPGRKPADGATYYVRYSYWTGFSTLHIPTP